MAIATLADLADMWLAVLKAVDRAGLLHDVLHVDLCNEFPSLGCAPFLRKNLTRDSAEGVRWMREPLERLRSAFPSLDYTFSFSSEYDAWRKQDVSTLDFIELHLWMTHFSDFYERLDYHYEAFDPVGYEKIQLAIAIIVTTGLCSTGAGSRNCANSARATRLPRAVGWPLAKQLLQPTIPRHVE